MLFIVLVSDDSDAVRINQIEDRHTKQWVEGYIDIYRVEGDTLERLYDVDEENNYTWRTARYETSNTGTASDTEQPGPGVHGDSSQGS